MQFDDAKTALEKGMDGVIVSDGAVGTLKALPDEVQAVGDQKPVLMASGIRHDSDIMKALALDAKAML